MNELTIPTYSPLITFLVLLIFMTIRYFGLVGLAYKLVKRFPDKRISSEVVSKQQMQKDIRWSVISTVIFAISGTWLIHLWQTGSIDIYGDPSKYGWTYFFGSLFIFMLLHDFYFYWTHRLLHYPWLFRRFHLAHHESRVPTAWTAFSFHPAEAILQAIILPILLLILPIHWIVLITFLSIMTVLGIVNHLGYEFYPKVFRTNKFSSFIISASHHQLHHQKVKVNFGLYFSWWDVLMRTEARLK